MSQSILLLTLLALFSLCLQASAQASISTPLRIHNRLAGLYARLDTTQSPNAPILADSVPEDTGRVWELEYSDPNSQDKFLIRNWHTGDRATAKPASSSPVFGAVYQQSTWERVPNDEWEPDYYIHLAGTSLVWTLTDDHRVILTNRTNASNQIWAFEILV